MVQGLIWWKRGNQARFLPVFADTLSTRFRHKILFGGWGGVGRGGVGCGGMGHNRSLGMDAAFTKCVCRAKKTQTPGGVQQNQVLVAWSAQKHDIR